MHIFRCLCGINYAAFFHKQETIADNVNSRDTLCNTSMTMGKVSTANKYAFLTH